MKLSRFFLLSIFFLFNAYIAISQQKWTDLGIHGIDLNAALEFDQGSKTIVIAADGGTVRSFDYGKTWDMKPNRFHIYRPSLWLVSKDTFMIGNTGEGVFATEDGGATITQKIEGTRLRHPWYDDRICGNPLNRRSILLCNGIGYHTTDLGDTWSIALPDINGRSVQTVAYSWVDTNIMCATQIPGWTRLFISLDGGKTWPREYKQPWPETRIHDIIISPKGYIYTGGLMSSDTGRSWKKIKLRGIFGADNFYKFAYNPHDKRIYAAHADQGLLRIQDGDVAYEYTRLSTPDEYLEPARRCMSVTIDTTSGTVFVGINDTLYAGRDSAFSSISLGLSTVPVNALCSLDASGDTLLAATTMKYVKSCDRGKTWRTIPDEGGMCDLSRYIFQSPINPRFLIFGCATSNSSMYFSNDGGETISHSHLSRIFGVPRFDPFDPQYIYFASNNLSRVRDSVIINWNSFDSIEHDSVCFVDFPIERFTFDPSRKGVIYAIPRGQSKISQVLRLTDYGTQSERLDVAYSSADWYNDIVVHPTDPSKIYIAAYGGVCISLDTGRTWTLYDNGFEGKAVTRVIFDPENPDIMFATALNDCDLYSQPYHRCRGGVYQSTNDGFTWERLPDEGLLNWNITEIMLVQNPRRLLVGTECGAYEYILPPVTSVESPEQPSASSLVLHQNYPNPFTSSTTITYSLPDGYKDKESLSLKIYDALGREVLDLSSHARTGNTSVTVTNAQLPRSGVYVCRLTAKNGAGRMHVAARRISFIK